MVDNADDSHRQAAVEPRAGQRLANARRANNISMRDIAKELHLDEVKVQALEDNRFEVLGAPVFAKGYLRKYAELVNVPLDDVLADYYRLNRAVGAPPVVGPKRERPQAELLSGPWIAAALIALSAAGATWWWLDRPAAGSGRPQAAENAGPQLDVQPAATPVQSGGDEDAAAVSPDTVIAAAENDVTAGDPPAGGTPASDGTANDATVDGSPAASSTMAEPDSAATAAPAQPAELQLQLSFRGDCWTEVTDGNGSRLYFGLGTDGRNIGVSGVPPLRILLGNSDNVSLTLNGQAYPVPSSALRGNTARLTIAGP